MTVEMKLEVIVLTVTDVDRAKTFYEKVGFNLDVDHQPNEEFRVVQFTPPGSACSITFGIGLGIADQRAVKGMHLVVSDIEEAVAALSDRGIELDPIRHMTAEGWADGPDPERQNYGSYCGFRDPDGNEFLLQEVGFEKSEDEKPAEKVADEEPAEKVADEKPAEEGSQPAEEGADSAEKDAKPAEEGSSS